MTFVSPADIKQRPQNTEQIKEHKHALETVNDNVLVIPQARIQIHLFLKGKAFLSSLF